MPNRVIRESMLDSTRYLSIDEGAQLLYCHLLLLADDFGTLSIESAFIGRRCFVNRPTDLRLDDLVNQLVDADLIRLYKYRDQRFAFIPRFRQRLKRETLKNPQPPDELLVDDTDAQEKFKKLNGHGFKGAAIGQKVGGLKAALGHEAAVEGREGRKEGREEKRSEEKGSEGSEEKGIEENPAPAESVRNPVEMIAAVAEKVRLKKN